MEFFEQFDLPFLTTVWFYLSVAIVALGVKWIKDLDELVHKRWYMPVALGFSVVAAVIVALGDPEYALSSVPVNAALIYLGQHLAGDQILKRLEYNPKE